MRNGTCGCDDSSQGFRVSVRGDKLEKREPPMGSRLGSEKGLAPGRGSLGAGGPGTKPQADLERTGEIPFGARPAVPEKPIAAPIVPLPPHLLEHDPAFLHLPGYVGAAHASPYRARPGMQVVFNAGLPAVPPSRGQHVAAPPAPQEVCFINEFDPKWGQPPEVVRALPLPFDPQLGAYRYDIDYVRAHVNLKYDVLARDTNDAVRASWEQGVMVQPYRLEKDGDWRFRWIPRSRSRRCVDAESARAGFGRPRPEPQTGGPKAYPLPMHPEYSQLDPAPIVWPT